MERKEQLKAVIELFMDILASEETSESKIVSEIKKPVVEELTNNGKILTKNVNDHQEKLKKAVAKSIEIIDKVEQIDKRNAFERTTKKQNSLIKNLRNEYSKIEDKFHEDERVKNEIDAIEQSRNASVNTNPQITKSPLKSKTKTKNK